MATVIVTVPVWISRDPRPGSCAITVPEGWSEGTSTIATVNPAECSVEIAACRSSPMTEGTTSSWYEDGSVHTSYVGSEPAGYWSTSMSWGGVYGFARHPSRDVDAEGHVVDVRRLAELLRSASPRSPRA